MGKALEGYRQVVQEVIKKHKTTARVLAGPRNYVLKKAIHNDMIGRHYIHTWRLLCEQFAVIADLEDGTNQSQNISQ